MAPESDLFPIQPDQLAITTEQAVESGRWTELDATSFNGSVANPRRIRL